jgi:hypothetical protein
MYCEHLNVAEIEGVDNEYYCLDCKESVSADTNFKERQSIRKLISCFTINDSHAVLQCPWTKDCQNTRCFWKQRDCFGRKAFDALPISIYRHNEINQQDQITAQYGEPYFPEWKITVGTNCMYISCKDKEI